MCSVSVFVVLARILRSDPAAKHYSVAVAAHRPWKKPADAAVAVAIDSFQPDPLRQIDSERHAVALAAGCFAFGRIDPAGIFVVSAAASAAAVLWPPAGVLSPPD